MMFEKLHDERVSFRVAEQSRIKTFEIKGDKDLKIVKQMKVTSGLATIQSCASYNMIVLINNDGNLQAIHNNVRL